MDVDRSRWSGDGDFTAALVVALERIDAIRHIRVEDAPSSRAEAGYSFISNEVYLAFGTRPRREPVRRFGLIPGFRRHEEKALTLDALEGVLAEVETIGPPDYTDPGMLQYLRTVRVVPPYQTRGYKQVELVRIYEASEANPPPV